MSAIFILSAQPTLPHHPDRRFDLILKTVGHAVEYAAFLVSVLYAASDEYHQTFVPGRSGRLVDVGVDTIGALVALLVVGSLGKKRRRA
jgi:VanZ family protein